jgi:hypothetical protein
VGWLALLNIPTTLRLGSDQRTEFRRLGSLQRFETTWYLHLTNINIRGRFLCRRVFTYLLVIAIQLAWNYAEYGMFTKKRVFAVSESLQFDFEGKRPGGIGGTESPPLTKG